MSSKLLEKLSPPGDLEELDKELGSCDELDSLPSTMMFNGKLVMINEAGYHPTQPNKGEVVFEEDDESSDVEVDFPVDSISRGYSISHNSDLRPTLRFEIVSTRICEEGHNRHVLYSVIVVRTEGLDSDKAVVEKRYSEFTNLCKELKKVCPELISKVRLPKKVFGAKNFDGEVIQTRCRAFEKFLSFIYTNDSIRSATAFKEFFYLPDLRQACSHIRGGKWTDSLRLLTNSLHLQQKLGDGVPETVATLGSLVVAYDKIGRFKEAEQYAEAALELIGNNVSSAYLIPLLNARIELCWRLGKDKKDAEKKLATVQRVCGIEVEHAFTLRELAVHRYTDVFD